MKKLVTRQEAEAILYKRFYNKIVNLKLPGYSIVCGKMNNIAFNGVEIIMHINEKRYTCSPECLNECLTLLTKT